MVGGWLGGGVVNGVLFFSLFFPYKVVLSFFFVLFLFLIFVLAKGELFLSSKDMGWHTHTVRWGWSFVVVVDAVELLFLRLSMMYLGEMWGRTGKKKKGMVWMWRGCGEQLRGGKRREGMKRRIELNLGRTGRCLMAGWRGVW
jgi:hypothetical protein